MSKMMTINEMRKMREREEKLNQLKLKAKALYLIGDISDAYAYLDTMVDREEITEDEELAMLNQIDAECANVYCYEIEEIRKMIEKIGG